MKMPLRRVRKSNIILIILFLATIFGGLTFARYMATGDIEIGTEIAKWSVKINGQPISDESTFVLDKLNWTGTGAVADGYAAPDGEGYYEINIDTTDTKVAVDYTLGFDAATLEDNFRMKIDRVTVNDSDITLDNGYYDGFIPLEEVLQNQPTKVRIYLNWQGSEVAETDDYSDTKLALDYGKIELPMVVMVQQHVEGEQEEKMVTQLLPYKETTLSEARPKDDVIIDPYYDASLDALWQNPERGMYSSNKLLMKESGNETKDMKAKVSHLLYLKVDLSAFAAWRNGGVDKELTDDVIETLKQQLENIKQNNNTVILRFVYDNDAPALIDGVEKVEPSQEMLKKHIAKLGEVFKAYPDTIYTIQIGCYGLWGETFYNTDVNSHPEYYQETMEALLDATEGTDITIALRTPKYAKRAIEGSSYDTSRVGVFNDALLSEDLDMGTFENRADDLVWMSQRSTSYGGEALPATIPGSKWDSVKDTEEEMFQSHMSYINFEWNQQKHYNWANQTYDGTDELYQGKTGLDFVQSHLGYRFVLRRVELPRTVKSGADTEAVITIENVGFANVIKAKKATLVLVGADDTVKNEIDVSDQFNIKEFNSRQTSGKTINFTLPQLEAGQYKLYLRIDSGEKLTNGQYYNAIRFANNNLWDETLEANKIGNLKVEDA